MSAGYLNLDVPDADTVYEHYLVTCKMLRRRADATGTGVRVDSGVDRSANGAAGADGAVARTAACGQKQPVIVGAQFKY